MYGIVLLSMLVESQPSCELLSSSSLSLLSGMLFFYSLLLPEIFISDFDAGVGCLLRFSACRSRLKDALCWMITFCWISWQQFLII